MQVTLTIHKDRIFIKSYLRKELMRTDNYYLHLCERLGATAAEKGNSPVGAIIVQNNNIISEAEEAATSKSDVTCHAEVEAIRIAVKKLNTADLSDCILFTTHEPCVLCSYVIRFHKIKKVVFQHSVEFLGGVSSSMPVLISKEVPPLWAPPPEVIHLEAD